MITRVGTYFQVKGIPYKLPCRVATTGNVSGYGVVGTTYAADGTKTINVSGFTSAPTTIDGFALSLSNEDRILVHKQTNLYENGIYVVSGSTDKWIRSEDFSINNTTSIGKYDDVYQGVMVYIVTGNTYGGYTFVLTTDDPIVLGVTDLVFEEYTTGGGGGGGTSGSSGTGSPGSSGTAGSSGVGSPGSSGTSGETYGTSGSSGTSGTTYGTSGSSGTSGKTWGTSGTSGNTYGTSGTSGTSGTTYGTSGSSGSGSPGSSGTSGETYGTSGTSGTTYGTSGSSGTSGSTYGTAGTSGETYGTSGSSGTSGSTYGTAGTSGETYGTSGSSGTGSPGSPGSSGTSGQTWGTSGTSGSSGTSGLSDFFGSVWISGGLDTGYWDSSGITLDSSFSGITTIYINHDDYYVNRFSDLFNVLEYYAPYLEIKISHIEDPNSFGIYRASGFVYYGHPYPVTNGFMTLNLYFVSLIDAKGVFIDGELYRISFSTIGGFGGDTHVFASTDDSSFQGMVPASEPSQGRLYYNPDTDEYLTGVTSFSLHKYDLKGNEVTEDWVNSFAIGATLILTSTRKDIDGINQYYGCSGIGRYSIVSTGTTTDGFTVGVSDISSYGRLNRVKREPVALSYISGGLSTSGSSGVGSTGSSGTSGETYGTSGTSGSSGFGSPGSSGTSGETYGTSGTSGSSGFGSPGSSGTSGETYGTSGSSGITGDSGSSGTSGSSGITGDSGSSGTSGSSGIGSPGSSGTSGSTYGSSGTSGISGADYPSGVDKLVTVFTSESPYLTGYTELKWDDDNNELEIDGDIIFSGTTYHYITGAENKGILISGGAGFSSPTGNILLASGATGQYGFVGIRTSIDTTNNYGLVVRDGIRILDGLTGVEGRLAISGITYGEDLISSTNLLMVDTNKIVRWTSGTTTGGGTGSSGTSGLEGYSHYGAAARRWMHDRDDVAAGSFTTKRDLTYTDDFASVNTVLINVRDADNTDVTNWLYSWTGLTGYLKIEKYEDSSEFGFYIAINTETTTWDTYTCSVYYLSSNGTLQDDTDYIISFIPRGASGSSGTSSGGGDSYWDRYETTYPTLYPATTDDRVGIGNFSGNYATAKLHITDSGLPTGTTLLKVYDITRDDDPSKSVTRFVEFHASTGTTYMTNKGNWIFGDEYDGTFASNYTKVGINRDPSYTLDVKSPGDDTAVRISGVTYGGDWGTSTKMLMWDTSQLVRWTSGITGGGGGDLYYPDGCDNLVAVFTEDAITGYTNLAWNHTDTPNELQINGDIVFNKNSSHYIKVDDGTTTGYNLIIHGGNASTDGDIIISSGSTGAIGYVGIRTGSLNKDYGLTVADGLKVTTTGCANIGGGSTFPLDPNKLDIYGLIGHAYLEDGYYIYNGSNWIAWIIV